MASKDVPKGYIMLTSPSVPYLARNATTSEMITRSPSQSHVLDLRVNACAIRLLLNTPTTAVFWKPYLKNAAHEKLFEP